MGTQIRPITFDEQYTQTVYEFDYYSGSQISIYFGNLLIDDIEGIQYSVTQSKRPIYGYASQYFHSVASGQVIVEGSFTIAFKESNYIISALNYYLQTMGTPTAPITMEKGKTVVSRENIEEYVKRTSKKPSGQSALPLDVLTTVAALDDQDWENVAETFEDVLWKGDGLENDFALGNVPDLETGDTSYYRRADQYPPVDIWITYGDMNSPNANHTIKKLLNVHIVGEGQLIQVGGENIHEQYRFFARNLA